METMFLFAHNGWRVKVITGMMKSSQRERNSNNISTTPNEQQHEYNSNPNTHVARTGDQTKTIAGGRERSAGRPHKDGKKNAPGCSQRHGGENKKKINNTHHHSPRVFQAMRAKNSMSERLL